MALADLAAKHDVVKEILDGSLRHVEAAESITNKGWATSETSVRRFRAQAGWERAEPSQSPEGWGKEYEVGPNGGTVCSGPVEKPITDPQELLKIWNLDPAHIEIVGDMTVKAWEMGIKNNLGKIETKQLFSYKARIRKKAATAIDKKLVESWRSALQSFNFVVPRGSADGKRVSYVVLIADPQLGKEGTTEALNNWRRGVNRHAEEIIKLVDEGYDVEVVPAFMGDETEGVANNYANQGHTIEMNLTEQLEVDYDMTMWTLKTLLPLAPRRKVSSVRSNHGEWTRNGSKDVVTTKADNSSTFIRSLVEKTFGEIDGFEDVTWLIGNQGPHVLADLSGIPCFFSHFYEQKGKGGSTEVRTRSAIERQIIGRTEELGDVKIFFTAHFHHFYSQSWEGRSQIGCPALEAEKSSGYMLNQYGVWSPPGMLGLAVGASMGTLGWGKLNVY